MTDDDELVIHTELWKQITELKKQGASYDEIEQLKLDHIKSRFENMDYDNLTNAREFLKELNSDLYD